MAYLCVNPDGVELICDDLPERWADVQVPTKGVIGSFLDKKTGTRYYIRRADSKREIKEFKVVSQYWLCEDIINMCDHIDRTIQLRTGTIEKLIGHPLTWDDEPVELI